MDKNIAIHVKNVSKTFRIPREKITSLRGAATSLFKDHSYEEFKALDNVSFDVKKGEFFGIIGRNGSGKSTLLKILAGIYTPDKGTVKVNGLISPFLELGIGFNPELSGRDNVFLNATVLGLTQKEISNKFDAIVKFAELERFIDQKLKNYSSGMQVRLAFAVSIFANREILLMDEVLAVGDNNFQSKCFEEFNKYRDMGRTVILVTHDVAVVEKYCDRAVLLHQGKLITLGNPHKVVDEYREINMTDEERRLKRENEQRAVQEKKKEEAARKIENKKKDNAAAVGKNTEQILERYGSRRALIKNFKIFNAEGKESFSLKTGESFKATFDIHFYDFVKNPVFGVMIRQKPNENLFGIHSYFQNNINVGPRKKGDILHIEIQDTINLNPGIFLVTPAVADHQNVSTYESLDVINNFKKINIFGPKNFWGVVYSKPKITIR